VTVADRDAGVKVVTVPQGTFEKGIETALEAAAASGAAEATVAIKVDDPYVDTATGETVEIREVKIELPVSELRAVVLSEVENARIVTEVGEITLNTSAMRDLITETENQGAAVVEITVEHKETLEDSSLTEAQETALSGDATIREVYDISVLINSSKQENFRTQTGKLTIGLPYSLRTGETSDGVWVHYIDKDGVPEKMVDGRRYDEARERSIFWTNHLSVYAIVYDRTAATPEQPADNDSNDDTTSQIRLGDSTGGGCGAGGIGGIIALAVLCVLMIVRGRRTSI
jgi:hypothetical protein